jgi:hypothetical protein
MNDHEDNLRDLAAMFAMCGLVMREKPPSHIMACAFELADMFLEKRKQMAEADVQDGGIAAIKPRKKPKDAQ